ncbi:MAG: serine hydrolase [bacterium]|nr:serine hydrolase [bacterium]
MKLFTIFLLLLLALTFKTIYSSQADNPQVDSTIAAFMTKWDLPGGSFTMAYDGTVLYSKGYGHADISTNEPVTTNSIFRIASCSKPFTAIAIMQLIQHGHLHLTDTVFGSNGILNQPQYQTILDPDVLNITIENLLEHTGGWDADSTGDPMFMAVQIAQWANVTPPAMQESIIEYTLSQMELTYTPGTTYFYSNFGFCVLGRVIEKITGQNYAAYVNQHVLIPSGAGTMKLGKNRVGDKLPNEVHYYGCPGETTAISVYGNGDIVPFPYAGFNIEAMDSHGQWVASSQDLVNFLTAVHRDKLITQHYYNIMVTPPAVNPGYAKGWGVNAGNIFHVGSLPGTISEIVKATNKYEWALVFNKRNVNSDDIYTDLDDLGWNIQKFLPPSLIDSCIVTGPDNVGINENSVYKTTFNSLDWEIFSYNGAQASLVSSNADSIVVNSGPTPGNYTVYKLSNDTDHIALCSLNVNIDAASPVELASFSSSVNQRNVMLQWSTYNEENNSGFEIERRSLNDQSITWNKIGFVNGNGTSGNQNDYNYNDVNVNSGRYKYRLKQIDYNGNYHYYELQNEVAIGTPDNYSLSQNYPNPFNPSTKINFDIAGSGTVKIIIYDINGKEVKTLVNGFREAGYYTVEFSASEFTSGIYFCKMESGSFMMTRKMLLLK